MPTSDPRSRSLEVGAEQLSEAIAVAILHDPEDRGLRGHARRSHQLRVLRTLDGGFTNLTLPAFGVIEVSVRYTDPYDVERASPWTTLRLPASPSTRAKARRGR